MKKLISKEEIRAKIHQVARQINTDFAGKDLVLVVVMKGALCFGADLLREITIPLTLETVQCTTYQGTSRGKTQVIGADLLNLHNKDVLIVDDLFDSGQTMASLFETFYKQRPRSLKMCVLLYKQNVPRVTDLRPDYSLVDIDNVFVVGYGLDVDEKYRNSPDLYVLEHP